MIGLKSIPCRKILIIASMIPFCLSTSIVFSAFLFSSAFCLLFSILIEDCIDISVEEAHLPHPPKVMPEETHLACRPAPIVFAYQQAPLPATHEEAPPAPSHGMIFPNPS